MHNILRMSAKYCTNFIIYFLRYIFYKFKNDLKCRNHGLLTPSSPTRSSTESWNMAPSSSQLRWRLLYYDLARNRLHYVTPVPQAPTARGEMLENRRCWRVESTHRPCTCDDAALTITPQPHNEQTTMNRHKTNRNWNAAPAGDWGSSQFEWRAERGITLASSWDSNNLLLLRS